MNRRRPALLAGAAAMALAAVVASPSTAAPGTFPERIDLPAGFMPEGITDGPGTTFYTGSLATGAVVSGDLRTGETSVLVAEASGPAVGMDHEASAGRLWVAGGPAGDVRVYDAAGGALLGSWQTGGGFLNDLVVTRDAVYVTDSQQPRLVVVPLGPGGALPGPEGWTSVPLGGDIVYVPGFNLNGLVALPSGELLAVHSSAQALYVIDPATGLGTEVPVTGGEVLGGDGLELLGSTLYVVRGGGGNDVAVLRIAPDGSSATVLGTLTDPSLSVPSTATAAAGHVWAVNARFGVPNPAGEYYVTRLPQRP